MNIESPSDAESKLGESHNESGAESTPPDSTRRFPFVTVMIGLAALALALYVATQVVGVLYGIIAPPAPPVPPDAAQLTYVNRAHGVDTWTYSVPMAACALADYYESLGATCEYALMQCMTDEDAAPPFTASETGVARCTAMIPFSIFTMGYTAAISRPQDSVAQSRLELGREVYWTNSPE